MNKRLLISSIITLGVLTGVWQLYFPHVFERICWLPHVQYEKTIHVVAIGSDTNSNNKINLVSTTSSANIYYCARFGAAFPPDTIPNDFAVPGIESMK